MIVKDDCEFCFYEFAETKFVKFLLLFIFTFACFFEDGEARFFGIRNGQRFQQTRRAKSGNQFFDGLFAKRTLHKWRCRKRTTQGEFPSTNPAFPRLDRIFINRHFARETTDFSFDIQSAKKVARRMSTHTPQKSPACDKFSDLQNLPISQSSAEMPQTPSTTNQSSKHIPTAQGRFRIAFVRGHQILNT